MAQTTKEYRALNNLNWTDKEGAEHSAAVNDKLTDLPENVVKHETAAGNLEKWVDRQTENVKDHEANSYMYGVRENSDGVLEEFEEGTPQVMMDNG